jgi:hypothetical protein
VREPSSGDADVVSVAIESAAPGSDPADGLRRGDALEARIGLLLRRPLPALDVAIIIKNQAGVRILDEAWSDRRDPRRLSETAGPREVSLLLPGTFAAGTYVLEVWLGTPEQNLFWDDVLRFEILPRFDDRREWAERDRLMQLDVRWNDGGEQ